jgi:transcription elongation factor S-II
MGQEVDIVRLKDSLTAEISSDVPDVEKVHDTLKALDGIAISVGVLKKTKIGLTVHSVKKANVSETVTASARGLIAKWRKVYELSQASSSTSEQAKEKQNSSAASTNNSSISKPNNNLSAEAKAASFKASSLVSGRKKMVDLLAKSIAGAGNPEHALHRAVEIEESICRIHNFDRDIKGYQAKARSLVFNLKKNEKLRANVLHGTTTAEAIVYMSVQDMATENQIKDRREVLDEAKDAKRSDYMTENYDKIHRDLGLDPNLGTQFTCGKCKSTKINYQQYQTRSSDEPMTTFLQCIKCGNRWKQ